MDLNKEELYDFLHKKNIYFFYHANTVATSLTFIKIGGIASREYLERNQLVQTSQDSDSDDKQFNVWNDVFLDTTDLHGFFPRQNIYGPVLFKFNLEFLLYENFNIWITKDNPIYWSKSSNVSEKYFNSINELNKLWDYSPRYKKCLQYEIAILLFYLII